MICPRKVNNMAKKALLIIDMLNDFLLPGAPLEVPKGREAIPCIGSEIRRARLEEVPIIYICDNHAPDDPEFAKWPPHCIRGTEGSEVVRDLLPREGDIIVPKTSYSGFYGTDLEEILKDLGVEKLTVTGILTDICILFTSCDAFMRGYSIQIPESCVAALSDEDHNTALSQIERLMEAEVVR